MKGIVFVVGLTSAAALAACTLPAANHLTNGSDMDLTESAPGETGSTTAKTTKATLVDDAGTSDGAAADTPASSSTTTSADAGAPVVDAGPTPFTTTDIQTLLGKRCAPCHTTNASAGLKLTPDFTTTTVGVPSTEATALNLIEKGSSDKSYLFHKLKGDQANVGGSGNRMPAGANAVPFTADELTRLAAWIDALQ